MTDRDHFAAAALTGLLARPDVDADPLEHHFCCEDAYKWADAMLRERGDHIADAGKMVETPEETQDGPASTPQVPRKLPRLLSGLQELINRSNAEAGSNTPDYVLADFLDDVRHAFDAAVRERERWYGRRNHDAAPAARATEPESSVPLGSGVAPAAQEPVAWAVVYPNDEVAVIAFKRRDADERATASDRVVPLYRQPQPTLTPEERMAVAWAVDAASNDMHPAKDILRELLERLGGGE